MPPDVTAPTRRRMIHQRAGHRDDLGLELLEAPNAIGFSRFALAYIRVRAMHQLLVRLARVIDEREHAAVAPVGVAGLTRAQLGEELVAIASVCGHRS